MLPINQITNSERMFETGKLQLTGTKLERAQEDLWFVAWLRNVKKFSREECYRRWLPFYLQIVGGEEDGLAESTFNKRWNAASEWGFEVQNNFYIFQEELDAINSTVVDRWIKESALLLLGYKRAYKIKKLDMESIPYKGVFTATSLGRRRDSNSSETAVFLSSGLCSYEVKERVDSKDGSKFDTFYITLNYERKNGTPILETNTLFDVISLFSKVECKKVCPLCGKSFEYHSKTKREICENCWREKRKAKQRECMKKLRNNM